MPLRSQEYCRVGRAFWGRHWVWWNGRGPHLAMRGNLVVFLELQAMFGVSLELCRGAQGASHVAPGKSSLHSSCEGRAALLSSHGRGIGPQAELNGESRGVSRVVAGNPGFPRLVTFTSGSFSGCLLEVRNTVELGGALGTPLGLVQWQRFSSRVEAGT